MPDLTDLRSICSALEHFALPAVLGNLQDDSLVFWNQAFQKRAGFSAIELAQARLTSLILLDESYSGIFLQDLTVYLGPDYLTPSSFSSAASPSAIGAAWPRSLAARNESALVHDKFVEIARHLSWKVTRSFFA